jgi:phage-related protein
MDKLIYWIGSSKQDLSKFPPDVRKKAGFQLRAVQKSHLCASCFSEKDSKDIEAGS